MALWRFHGKRLREVIYDIGGGIKNDAEFKAVQIGGPSGGCIPAELLDTAIGYKELMDTGAIMGSGGMVVMDISTCMVGMARYFLDLPPRSVRQMCPLQDRHQKNVGDTGENNRR